MRVKTQKADLERSKASHMNMNPSMYNAWVIKIGVLDRKIALERKETETACVR
jgi:hypothetical protein